MKATLLLCMLVLGSIQVYAQNDSDLRQGVYFEVGGTGLIYTFNYDFRFDKSRQDSWGMKVGAGGYWIQESGFFSLPLEINRLFGNGPHYFEVGAGVTFLAFKSNYYVWNCDEFSCEGAYDRNRTEIILPINGSPNAMGTLNLGYRRIPITGGISWKVNLTPIYNQNGFWPLFAGAGIGYVF